MQVQLLKHTSPYSGYGLKQTFALDQTLREFQQPFTVPGGDKTDARLMFQLGIDIANGDQVWIDAFKGGPRTYGDFLLAGPICDAMNLAAVSLRLGGRRLLWDAAAATITNVPEANALLTRQYREGWQL